ncbi:MAG TPA: heavy metal-associated domain-containing protein [Candidatus Polarisedimenticolia bacterium]|nr:heavy metal-associated domain-containing protein [Candidatus Polarisedimenticolia bacterium]
MSILQNRLRSGSRSGAVAALAAALLLPAPAGAGVQSVVIPVSGMTCALCTRGVEESIRRLDGVGGVTADLATGLVKIEAAEGKSLNVQQVKERIAHAGFSAAGECTLMALGRFALGPQGRITFRVSGTNASYQVLEGNQLRRLFKEYRGVKGEFILGFRVHDHPSWKPPAISIISFAAAPAASLSAAR